MITTLRELHAERMRGRAPATEVVYSVCGPLDIPVLQIVVPASYGPVDFRANFGLDVIVAVDDDSRSIERGIFLVNNLIPMEPSQVDIWNIDNNSFVNITTNGARVMMETPPPYWAMEKRNWRQAHE